MRNFYRSTDFRIDPEKLISNLKSELQKASKKFDKVYLESIEQINKTNAELQVKVDSYNLSTENDWEDFRNKLMMIWINLEKQLTN